MTPVRYPYFAVLLYASDESRPVGVLLAPANVTARARLGDYFDAWRMLERMFPEPGELAGLEAHVNASRVFFDHRYDDPAAEIEVFEALHHGLFLDDGTPVTYDVLRDSFNPIRVEVSQQLQNRLDEFGGNWRARISTISGTNPSSFGVTYLEYESDEDTSQLESLLITETQLVDLFGPFPPHRVERVSTAGARYERPSARPRRLRGMPSSIFESVRPQAQHHFEVWYWTREEEDEPGLVSFPGMSEPYSGDEYQREAFPTYEDAFAFTQGLETGFRYGRWERDPAPLTSVARLNDAFRKGNDAGVGAADISYYVMNPVSVLLADLPRDPALWIASRWLREDSELDLEEFGIALTESDGADIRDAGREITWHIAEAKGDITSELIQPGTDPDATFPGLGAHVAAYLEATLATRTPETIEWENEGGRHPT